MTPASPLPDSPRILCIRLSALGDTLLTLPAVAALKHEHPGARIAFLTDPRHALVLEGSEAIDEVLLLDRKQLKGLSPAGIRGLWRDVIRPLVGGPWDAVVDLQCYTETAALAALTRAPIRVGRPYKTSARWLYRNWIDDPHPDTYMTEAHVDTLRRAGLVSGEAIGASSGYFTIPVTARTAWDVTAAGLELSPAARTVGLFVGAARADRRWSPRNFARLADELTVQSDAPLQFLVFAGPDEEGIASAVLEQVEASANSVYRAPTSDLLELAAAFASCRTVVSNDTGPLHLSAAVGTPTCGIYRRGLPHFLLPEPHRTLVAPERDITRVSVADVAAAASELLH